MKWNFNGIVPMLRVFNNTARYGQEGKEPVFTVYLNTYQI